MVAFLDRIVGRIVKKLGSKYKSVMAQNDSQEACTKDCFKDYDYEIGDYTYGCPSVIVWDDVTRLHIGKFCSIAAGVTIMLGGNHRTDWVTTYPFNVLSQRFPNAAEIKGHPATKGDVWIGNDVWIGRGATILSGVRIGDGAVIGLNAVVSKDVEPYSIVVGNPGRVVKKRFDEKTIEALLKIRWWDWDEERINQETAFLCSSNIQEFIDKNLK